MIENCLKRTKYLKGAHTRETLVQAKEIRSDENLRQIAIRKCDENIIAVTSRDIVAAEAWYHRSCYKYTRPMRAYYSVESKPQVDH